MQLHVVQPKRDESRLELVLRERCDSRKLERVQSESLVDWVSLLELEKR